MVVLIFGIAILVVAGMLILRNESEQVGIVATTISEDGSLEFPPEALEEIRQAQQDEEKVRRSDPQFFEAVSRAMFEHDLIGINYETNTDEYDAEAGTVIPRLDSCDSGDDVATVLHEEFTSWFGQDMAGGRARYVDLGEEIWNLQLQRISE